MNGQQRFLNRMIVFVLAVALLAAVLAEQLSTAFLANPLLNGIIGVVLLLGIVYSFRQVLMLKPETEWLKAYRRGNESLPERSPRLLGPLAAMIGDQAGDRPVRMTAMSMRSLLDSVDSRLDEGREISRYLTRLLIFLGLLGTFWGLLAVLAAIGNTIQSLSVETSDLSLMFDALKRGLEEPLSGMAIAFSSSLFGLAGSVILGFLDLQSGQAQNRFYNNLEDWLSTVAKVSRGGPSMDMGDEDGASLAAGSYLSALLEQTADSLDQLRRTMEQSETARGDANAGLMRLSEGLSALTDQMRSDQAVTKRLTDAQIHTQRTLERFVDSADAQTISLDDVSMTHLRNMDLSLRKLLEDQNRASEKTGDLLRSEMKMLARTLAAALDRKPSQNRPSGSPQGDEGQ
ncbi:flagellar motor protein MotA [Iodidimonas muriae]|uniref:Flagellar motor protein MotA n=1 Tax=Iodidimonas muriae TaxID=261467 RepID=A0ABQ2LBT3_9PROT|nr:MotA/TolQ/ExbB proton channel family protein [Iodidimonas muriae]GER06863.1 flagellar motor protein MotA [Kordiimonadales bacterium JCM 17843]GGO09724.1 flagellar motor protein MotA [Iodidimonas muriae]